MLTISVMKEVTVFIFTDIFLTFFYTTQSKIVKLISNVLKILCQNVPASRKNTFDSGELLSRKKCGAFS